MSDTQSNESQLLRGAVKPTLIVGAIAISTMAMALFSYFAKLFFLGLFLWALAKYTDRDVIDRLSFGVAACALTVAWLGGEIASYLKLKTHLPLPPQAKP